LLAIDKTLLNVGRNSEISGDQISRELTKLSKFKSDEVLNDIAKELSKINSLILLPGKRKLKSCSESEVQFLNENYSAKPSIIRGQNEEFSVPRVTFNKGEDPNAGNIRMYFPEVWLFDGFRVDSTLHTLNIKAPAWNKPWIVSGFSLNPEKGLALVGQQEISVDSKDFYITIDAPHSARVGEVIPVSISIYNKHDHELDVSVTLYGENQKFEFVKAIHEKDLCYKYSSEEDVSKSFTMIVQSKSSNKKGSIFVRLLKNGKVKFNASVNNSSQRVVKEIIVFNEGITKETTNSIFVNLNGPNNFEESIILPNRANINDATIQVSISGNIFGQLIENIDKL
jgi:CD109 antigen